MEFDELKISTRTVIASTGLDFDIEKIFHSLPLHHETRQFEMPTRQKEGEDRTMMWRYRRVAIYFKNEWKCSPGWSTDRLSSSSSRSRRQRVLAKEELSTMSEEATTTTTVDPPPKKKTKSFRNALNVIYEIQRVTAEPVVTEVAESVAMPVGHNRQSGKEFKHVNFKISKNGKFQLTGCRDLEFAYLCVLDCLHTIFYSIASSILQPHRDMIQQHGLSISFQTVMTNLDFHVGYTVNRQLLDMKINQATEYYSLLETSFGYTGVNIKFPLSNDWWFCQCPLIHWIPHPTDPFASLTFSAEPLVNVLTPETLERYQKKGRYNTFLVFHSGKVIMSGMFAETMRDHYRQFRDMMRIWKEDIQEKIKK